MITDELELLTIADVARLCRVHAVTVRRSIAAGAIPAVRVGRGVRVRRQDLAKYLGANGQPAEIEQPAATRPRYLTGDDSIWDIVGMVEGVPGEDWVSGDKHRALTDAYAPKP